MSTVYPHKTINTIDITFDKKNPRGLSKDQILESEDFKRLLTSISTYGILEPLIIKPDVGYQDKYILIDGERRLHAALKANLDQVPTVIAPNETEGRILAYQIHMLRLQWSRIAQIKAIRELVSDLKADFPNLPEEDLKSKVKEITSKDPSELNRDFKLLVYPDEIIQKIEAKEPAPIM